MSAEFDKLQASADHLLKQLEHAKAKVAELEARIANGVEENKKLHAKISTVAEGKHPDAEAMVKLAEQMDQQAADVGPMLKPDPMLNPLATPAPATDPLGAPPVVPKPNAFSAKPEPVKKA